MRLCFRVENGDRLGLHFEEIPGAVAYTFNATKPVAYGKHINSSTPVGEIEGFSTLTFPYSFSVAAYIDTGKFVLHILSEIQRTYITVCNV